MVAGEILRKVRASQNRVPVNGWWRRLQGECNRNIPHTRLALYVRVEKCGKSALGLMVT